MIFLSWVLVSFTFFGCAFGSLGNSFPWFRLCLEMCKENTCDQQDEYSFKDPSNIPVFVHLLWNCIDDCKYHCMWDTVAYFERKGWQPPQFHGKWPFARLLGIQEPASTLFSLMNLGVHIKMYKRFTEEVKANTPLYLVWTLYAIVCINGWMWSAIFHGRDLPFTETMDYLSAFGMVFYVLFGVGRRILLRRHKSYAIGFTIICIIFFANHALYLTWDTFDYKYNMIANISAGSLASVVSLLWCGYNWQKLPHSRYLAISVLLCVFTTVLELSDFPPLGWVLDAHSLWHLSTVPIPYYFWRFIIEDSKYLRKSMYKWFKGNKVIIIVVIKKPQ